MTAIEDAGMTDEEKVIYILRRSFHETPNDRAMEHIARTILDSVSAPPTDDEREALRRIIEPMLRGWMDESGYSEDVIVGLADDISGEVLDAHFRRQGPITSDDPVPRYAQCDLWQALFGVDTSGEYEGFREEHSYADTWSWLLDRVRRRQGPITDAQVEDALAMHALSMHAGEGHRAAMRAALEAARDA